MAWTTPETFTSGQTLTSASMNIISANARMGGPVFTNEAARDAAITSPEEGMTAYLTAPTVPAATGATTALPTGITTIYNGSAWVCVTPVAALSNTSGTTTSATYVSTLTGDATAISVTLATGTSALVAFTNRLSVGALATFTSAVSVSGATTVAAASSTAVTGFAQPNGGYVFFVNYYFPLTGLTAGTNTFTLNYATSASTATLFQRSLIVQGIA